MEWELQWQRIPVLYSRLAAEGHFGTCAKACVTSVMEDHIAKHMELQDGGRTTCLYVGRKASFTNCISAAIAEKHVDRWIEGAMSRGDLHRLMQMCHY